MLDTYYTEPQENTLADNLVYKRRYLGGGGGRRQALQVVPPGVQLYQVCLVSYRHNISLRVEMNIFYLLFRNRKFYRHLLVLLHYGNVIIIH